MAKSKVIKLSAYLLKEDYALGDPLFTDEKMSEHDIDLPNSGAGKMYISQATPHAPGWAWFLLPLGDEVVGKLRVATASAVVVIKAGGRFFAVCFGHGYASINSRHVETRFGLRTCLNAVDPETIRTLDKRTFDSI